MSTALNLLAVQNAAILRALATRPADGWSLTGLATHVGRDKSNLSKTLAKLEDEGLAAFNPLMYGLTEAGQQQLAMIEKAENSGADGEPGSSGAGIIWLTHAEITPDPDNARRDWDSDDARDDLDALRSDIIQNGLLQNMVVRAPDAEGQPHILVGGERRWRAIGIAISDGDIEFDTPYACRLLVTDDLGVRLAALAENLQRRNLNPIEKARAFEGLAEAGLSNKEIADRVSSTPEHIQQHRRFLQLDETDQQRMTLAKDDPSHLSVREARQKLARKGEEETVAAEEAEYQAKITPEVRLAMAEFFHRVRIEGSYTTADLRVSANALETPNGMALAELGWVTFTSAPSTWGKDAGHFTARLSWNTPQLFDWEHSADRDVLFAGLAAAYADHGTPPPANGYANAWLNPDPALTPDGEAIVAAAEERERVRQAERAEQEKAKAERNARWAKARTAHAALLTPHCDWTTDHIYETTRSTAANIDHALPWSLKDDGSIIDADGKPVMRIAHAHWAKATDQDLATAQLTVLSVNRAAGLKTPPIIITTEAQEAEGEDDEGNDEEDAA